MASNYSILIKMWLAWSIMYLPHGVNAMDYLDNFDYTASDDCKCAVLQNDNESMIGFQYNFTTGSGDGENKQKRMTNAVAGRIFTKELKPCNISKIEHTATTINKTEWTHVNVPSNSRVCYHYDKFEHCVDWEKFSRKFMLLHTYLKPIIIIIIITIGILMTYQLLFVRPKYIHCIITYG